MNLTFDEVKEYASLVSKKLLSEGKRGGFFGENDTQRGWFLRSLCTHVYDDSDQVQSIDTRQFFLGEDGDLYIEESNFTEYIGDSPTHVINNTKFCYKMTENDAAVFNNEYISDEIKEGDVETKRDISIGPLYQGRNQGLYIRLHDLAEIDFKKNQNDHWLSEIKTLAKFAADVLKVTNSEIQSFADEKSGWALLSRYRSVYDKKYKVEEGRIERFFLGTDGELYIEIESPTYDNGEELTPYVSTRKIDSYFDTSVFNTVRENRIIDEGRYEKDICFNVGIKYTGQNEGLYTVLKNITG